MSEPRAPEIRWTGAFADSKLEAEFLEDRVSERRRFLRFSLAVATFGFLAYGPHDLVVVPEVSTQALAIRYGLFIPVALAVFWVVGSPHLKKWGQIAALAYGLAANVIVLAIAAIAPPHGFFLYSSYAVLFVTLGPFVARMSVVTQLVYTALTLIAYNAIEIFYVKSPFAIRVSINMTIVALGTIGALIAHQLDRIARGGFLQARLIQRQVKELDVEKTRSETLLLNVLPAKIAERLKEDSEAIAEGFEDVSVLFADIAGFTKMSERLEPQELVERLNTMFSSFDDLVDKLKLEKIKTIGDAYMVAGGLHSREYDHAQAIAEMALAMQRRFESFSERFGERLDLRIGIHCGPVVAGVIGKRKFSYDVWGDTVNTASRMVSHAERGTIQVSETFYERLKGLYEFRLRGEIEVKGKGRMTTYYLEAPLPDSTGHRAARTQNPRKLRNPS